MDGKILEQIRDSLLSKWRQIERHTVRDLEQSEDLTSAHAEIIDIAQSLEQLGRDTSLREAERREQLAIERALAKMSSGSFGTCEDCGEEIPARRLIVLPAARLCANCQAFEEKQAARSRFSGAAAR
jgi:DnaK suppressor protein